MIRCLLALAVNSLALVAGQSPAVLSVDPSSSQVTIEVGKAGALSFAGHVHEVVAPALRGEVRFDEQDLTRSSVTLEFDTAAMRVTGKGEPAKDVPEVQRVMLSERVLDVKKYPTISFTSRRVTMTRRVGADIELSIAGDLALHGQTRPVTIPVRVTITNGALAARGTFQIKQTDYGIQPVAAGAGTVRVKNELGVTFAFNAPR